MAATITQAMIARFLTSGAMPLVQASQSPWINDVPEEVLKTLPFVVLLDEGSDGIEYTGEDTYKEMHRFTWLVMAGGTGIRPIEQAETIALEIKKSFDGLGDTTSCVTALPVSNARAIQCRRTGYKIDKEGVDKDGNDVVSVTLPYEVWVQAAVGVS